MRALHTAAFTLLFLFTAMSDRQAAAESLTMIFEASREAAKDAVLQAFIPNGYRIKTETDHLLVLDRPVRDNLRARLAFGSSFNGIPTARIRVAFLGNDPVTIHYFLAVVTNTNSNFESERDLSISSQAHGTATARMREAKLNAEQ